MNNNGLNPATSLALMQAAQAPSLARTDALTKTSAADRERAKFEEAAQDFEAVFMAEMMKPMFEGIEISEPFGGGHAEEIFRKMMLQEYGKMMAASGGIGLSAQVREEMIKMQEERDRTMPIPDLETNEPSNAGETNDITG